MMSEAGKRRDRKTVQLCGQGFKWLISALLLVCLTVPQHSGASNDMTVTNVVTSGDQIISIPTVSDASLPAEIRVAFTTDTNVWRIVHLYEPEWNGWTLQQDSHYLYQHAPYDPGGTFPVSFSGRLERVRGPAVAGHGGVDTN